MSTPLPLPEFEIVPAIPTLLPATLGILFLIFAPVFRNDRRALWGISVFFMTLSTGITAYLFSQITVYGSPMTTAGVPGLPMIHTDQLALLLSLIFSVSAVFALAIMPTYLERAGAHRPEVYALIPLAVSGMIAMVSTENLLMIFVGLEVFSISLYVLCGIARDRSGPVEAALKYFLLGAFSTAFFVYGIALVLGATGHLDLPGIAAALGAQASLAPFSRTMLFAGLGLIIVAFSFKIGAVPFHFWAPDAYQGAPTPVTAFMAAATKAAAFGILLRILASAFSGSAELIETWGGVIAALAVVTMLGGNLLALVQQRLKRLLAYSSIAHAGYLLLALIPAAGASGGADAIVGAKSLLFYLVVYTFMTLGAFAVVALFQEGGEDADHVSNFSGLWHRRPWLAVSMAVFMLSLTGIPPLGGFTGKYVIFMAAVDAGHAGLAVIMAVAAVIGAAYYLRVLVAMFLNAPESDVSDKMGVPLATSVVVGLCVLATIALGVLPYLVYDRLDTVLATAGF